VGMGLVRHHHFKSPIAVIRIEGFSEEHGHATGAVVGGRRVVAALGAGVIVLAAVITRIVLVLGVIVWKLISGNRSTKPSVRISGQRPIATLFIIIKLH
jgi:hypothetical protein